MPINKATRTPTGVTVGYHKLNKLEVDLVTNTAVIVVTSHADAQAAIDNLPAAWWWRIDVSADRLVGGSSLAGAVEAFLIGQGGTFEGGEVVVDQTASLDDLKDRKRAEITRARLAADADHFTYEVSSVNDEGETVTVTKEIKTADKDMIDLLTTNSYVTLFGEFDETWPGGWKAMDNSYVLIATVEEWKPFFKAMYQKGIANFRKSQTLKAEVDAAETVEALQAVSW